MSKQFSPEEAFDFLQKMWNPLGFSMPGMGASPAPGANMGAPGGFLPTLDPAEIERKIQELKVVENWLAMNVSLLQTTIKTLELQKVSLEALRSAHAPAAANGNANKSGRGRKS